MTKTTAERLAVIETTVNELKQQNTVEHTAILDALEKLEKAKANKWVETFVIIIITSVITTLIGYLLLNAFGG